MLLLKAVRRAVVHQHLRQKELTSALCTKWAHHPGWFRTQAAQIKCWSENQLMIEMSRYREWDELPMCACFKSTELIWLTPTVMTLFALFQQVQANLWAQGHLPKLPYRLGLKSLIYSCIINHTITNKSSRNVTWRVTSFLGQMQIGFWEKGFKNWGQIPNLLDFSSVFSVFVFSFKREAV